MSEAIRNAARNRAFGPGAMSRRPPFAGRSTQEREQWTGLPSEENPRSASGRQSKGWTNTGLVREGRVHPAYNNQGQRRLTRA